MKLENSLPHVQMPATCPCFEPFKSSACLPIPFFEDTFQNYLLIYA